MGNNMEDPQKTKNGATIWPYNIYSEKIMVQKDTYTLVFVAALFTIAKTQKEPKCLSTEEWMK